MGVKVDTLYEPLAPMNGDHRRVSFVTPEAQLRCAMGASDIRNHGLGHVKHFAVDFVEAPEVVGTTRRRINNEKGWGWLETLAGSERN